VLLDTGRIDAQRRQQVFIRARLPVPVSSAQLASVGEDSAHVTVGVKGAPVWHTWSLDGGSWQPLRETSELAFADLLPGRHTVEVRAFNAELTPSNTTSTVAFEIALASEAQFAASLRGLASPGLDEREAAARMLRKQGPAAVPILRAAREAASSDVQWWIDAIIQHIERQQLATPGQVGPPSGSERR